MPDLVGKKRSAPVRLIGADPVTGSETNFQAVNDDNDAQVVDTPNTDGAYKSLSVDTTAIELKVGAATLTGRKSISIQPRGRKVYFGYDNSVTTNNGTEVFKNQTFILSVGPSQHVWLISNQASGVNVRITES